MFKFIKSFNDFLNENTQYSTDTLQEKILDCFDISDFVDILKELYGDTVPLYHATSLETSEVIDKEGIKLVDGTNLKSWTDDKIIYFQIGKSSYVADNRPVLYKWDAPIEVLEKFMYIDTDSSASDEEVQEFYEENGLDFNEFEEKSSEVKSLISACIANGFKVDGMEIYLMDVNDDGDFPVIIPTKITE